MLVTPDVLASSSARLPEDTDPQETAEWLEAMEAVLKHGGPERAKFLLETLIARSPTGPARSMPGRHHHALRQHDPGRGPAAVPRRPRARTADQEHRPLERDGDGAEGEQEHQRRRAHLHLRQRRHALRNRLQPLLPRPHRRPPRRRRLLPGPRQPRHVRPGLRRGPARRDEAQELPPGTAARRRAVRATRTRG